MVQQHDVKRLVVQAGTGNDGLPIWEDAGYAGTHGIVEQIIKDVVIVDFGFASGGEDSHCSTTVLSPSVYEDCALNCVFGGLTDDHGVDDPGLEGVMAYGCNIIPGVSYTVMAYCQNGTWGQYAVKVTG